MGNIMEGMAWATILDDLGVSYDRHVIQQMSMEFFDTYDYEDLSLENLRHLKDYLITSHKQPRTT